MHDKNSRDARRELNSRFASSCFLSLTTLLLLCLGCAHTHEEIGRQEARGDRYTVSARHDLARAEYARALSSDPENARLQKKLAESDVAYTAHLTAEIQSLLDEGQPLRAMEALARAQRAMARRDADQDQHFSRLEEDVLAATRSAIRVAVQAQDLERAYRLQHALASRYPPERSKVSALDVDRTRRAWIASLEDRARDDEEQNLLASAALYWFKVHSLTGEEAHLLRARDDQRRAVEKHRYEVSIMQGDSPIQGLDAALQEALGEDHHLLLLPHLEAALGASPREERAANPVEQARGVHRLSEGSAASGCTLTMALRDLRCDERLEKRATYAASTPRDTLVQRCMATVVVQLFPTDGNRDVREVEEFLVEEFAHEPGANEPPEAHRIQHDVKLIDRLYARGAAFVPPLLEEDLEEAHTNLLERALSYPLERAELDARVLLYWLSPERHASAKQLDRIRARADFEDLVTLLNAR